MLHRALLCFISVGMCITICQATALGDACSTPSFGENDQCAITVANSICQGDKCQCMDRYTEEEGECKISLENYCSQDSDCVSNSKCLGTTGMEKCTCAEGYFAKDGLCSRVLGTACTSSTESTVCALRNTGCKDGVCACNLGYKGSVTCSLIVGTSCTEQNKTTACSLKNAECKNRRCACMPGYYGNTCLKIIGSDCSGSAACPGDANTMCKSDKCECKEGYADNDDVCTQNVDGIDCSTVQTACDNTENAVCDTDNGKCKCKSGYTMNVDKCNEKNIENSAAMTGYGAIVLALSLLASYLMLL